MVETFIKVRIILATRFWINCLPIEMDLSCHLVDLVECWCPTCFINLYLALTCLKLPLNAKKDLLIMEAYLPSAIKPGLLPSRDRICALGTRTPSKNILSLRHRYTFCLIMFYWSITSFAGVHQKSDDWACKPCCYDERLEKKNQVGSAGKDWMSCALIIIITIFGTSSGFIKTFLFPFSFWQLFVKLVYIGCYLIPPPSLMYLLDFRCPVICNNFCFEKISCNELISI